MILGGGFGGLAAATELARQAAGEHRITLVDRKDWFQMGLAKLWTLVGSRRPEDGRGDLSRLAARGIRFIRGDARALVPADREVRVVTDPNGPVEERLPYDALLVALGAETDAAAVPGLPAGDNLYDAAAIPGLRDRLKAMTRGRIAIVIVKPPYKCPPAPYEAALLVDQALTDRNIRAAFAVAVYLPEKLPMTVAGPAVGAQVKAFVEGRNIRVDTERVLERVEPGLAGAGRLHFVGGASAPYDLLLAVPAHRPPTAVAALTGPSGWIEVDATTLATAHPGIWAVGDVTAVKLPGGGFLPKAGVFAEAEGRVVAEQILARLEGRPANTIFDGIGHCWFEVGGGKAMAVRGTFFGDPAGRVALTEPTEAAFRDKQGFERDRLAAWLA